MAKFMRNIDYVIFSSYGNDSIALIRHVYEKKLKNILVLYSDTQWDGGVWIERVKRAEIWVKKLGFKYDRIESIGMMDLVRMKKGWPRNGLQFCTEELKINPAKEYLNLLDKNKGIICMTGVRREESYARRSWPEWVEESDKHDGRSLWSPLVSHTEKMRNELIEKSDLEILPHRSMECNPCINANKSDLRLLTKERISFVENFEYDLGFTSKGNLRTMFRPASKGGAIGIREVIDWANSDNGKYDPLEKYKQCNSGFCGI